jgi:hypothetical protein
MCPSNNYFIHAETTRETSDDEVKGKSHEKPNICIRFHCHFRIYSAATSRLRNSFILRCVLYDVTFSLQLSPCFRNLSCMFATSTADVNTRPINW